MVGVCGKKVDSGEVADRMYHGDCYYRPSVCLDLLLPPVVATGDTPPTPLPSSAARCARLQAGRGEKNFGNLRLS